MKTTTTTTIGCKSQHEIGKGEVVEEERERRREVYEVIEEEVMDKERQGRRGTRGIVGENHHAERRKVGEARRLEYEGREIDVMTKQQQRLRKREKKREKEKERKREREN